MAFFCQSQRLKSPNPCSLISQYSSKHRMPSSASVSFPKFNNRNVSLSITSASLEVEAPARARGVIALSGKALKHLNKMRAERSEDLCLRIGVVKQGGLMSYTFEFDDTKQNSTPNHSIIQYNGFILVCDPKSLALLYGMQLDYSDALVGGGFHFKNPNATKGCCGCKNICCKNVNVEY